jgi:transposase
MRLSERLRFLDKEINELEQEISRHGIDDKNYERLMKTPAVGTLTASALIATFGNASSFKNAKQLAAWLGLVPRQHSCGGKQKLYGISKRGDVYLRTLLIHGARQWCDI